MKQNIDTAHIIVTQKCSNTCPKCCNKEYSFEDIPFIRKDELDSIGTICLTGGEPFSCKNIEQYIYTLKKYCNNLYVYTSGYELSAFVDTGNIKCLNELNGFSMSPKTERDWQALNLLLENHYNLFEGKQNRLYVFIEAVDTNNKNFIIQENVNNNNCNTFHHYTLLQKCCDMGFNIYFRAWVPSIVSQENEIFRRININEF